MISFCILFWNHLVNKIISLLIYFYCIMFDGNFIHCICYIFSDQNSTRMNSIQLQLYPLISVPSRSTVVWDTTICLLTRRWRASPSLLLLKWDYWLEMWRLWAILMKSGLNLYQDVIDLLKQVRDWRAMCSLTTACSMFQHSK